MEHTGRVLVVDDEVEFCRFVEDCLGKVGYEVESVQDPAQAEARIRRGFDLLVSDVKMGGVSGLDVMRQAREVDPTMPVVLVTAFGSIDSAVEAMRLGAANYLTKPVTVADLRLHVERAMETRLLRAEVTRLKRFTEDLYGIDNVVARSASMRRIIETVRQLEGSTCNVLITGESGTGKELLSRTLHLNCPMREGPFVPINCAAIPEFLLESELFGHVRGAFTDARHDKAGLFQQAHGGTLLLDEIGEMPPALQVKLLRALEERSVRRVGATESEPIDIRVIAATNRDLELAIAAGAFRADLYYRLNVVELAIPPLRERTDDVPPLIDRLLRKLATNGMARRVAPEAREALLHYDWPGNVRQLENVLERALALARGDTITIEDLPDTVRGGPAPAGHDAAFWRTLPPALTLEDVSQRYMLRVLEHTHGNRSAAAAVLGIDRKTLAKRLAHAVPRIRRGA
jgi:DNA-binding NtrC family response regulator